MFKSNINEADESINMIKGNDAHVISISSIYSHYFIGIILSGFNSKDDIL